MFKTQRAEGLSQGQPQHQVKLRQSMPVHHTFASPAFSPSQKYQPAKTGPMFPQRKLPLGKKMPPRPTNPVSGPPGSPQRFEKHQPQPQPPPQPQQPITKKLGPPLPPFRGTKLQRPPPQSQPQPQAFPHPVTKQYAPSPNNKQEVPRQFPRPKVAPGPPYIGFRGQPPTTPSAQPPPQPQSQPQSQSQSQSQSQPPLQQQQQPAVGAPFLPSRKRQDAPVVSPAQSPPIQNERSQSPVAGTRGNSHSPSAHSTPPAPPPQSMKPQSSAAESQPEKEKPEEESPREKRKTQRIIPKIPDKRMFDVVNTESLQQLLERVSKSNAVNIKI